MIISRERCGLDFLAVLADTSMYMEIAKAENLNHLARRAEAKRKPIRKLNQSKPISLNQLGSSEDRTGRVVPNMSLQGRR